MTSARQARMDAGLSIEEAAKRAGVSTDYLRAIERRGRASYVLAMRLSRIYRCSANVFLYPASRDSETSNRRARIEIDKQGTQKGA